jgi:hypothetical protein
MVHTWLTGSSTEKRIPIFEERIGIVHAYMINEMSWKSAHNAILSTLEDMPLPFEMNQYQELLARSVVAADKADNLHLASRCLQKLTGKHVSNASRAINHQLVAPYYKLYNSRQPSYSSTALREIRKRWQDMLDNSFRTMFI